MTTEPQKNDGQPNRVKSTLLRQAMRMFYDDRREEIKESSLRAYKFPLRHFIEFCEAKEIMETDDLIPYHVTEWKETRREDDIKQISLRNDTKKVKTFLRWCGQAGLMRRELAETIKTPTVTKEQAVNRDRVTAEEAGAILDYFERFEYATRGHAAFLTMWHTGCRVSGLMALDVSDFDPDNSPDGLSVLRFRDRPQAGTALKNSRESERDVNIKPPLRDVLTDYIAVHRHDVTDEYDREPLFTTRVGRPIRNTIYKTVTARSRPCVYDGSCPHERDPEECEAALSTTAAPGCPSSYGNHAIRTGSISHHINQGWPKEKLSERVDVSPEVLDDHYDMRKTEEARKGREEFMNLL